MARVKITEDETAEPAAAAVPDASPKKPASTTILCECFWPGYKPGSTVDRWGLTWQVGDHGRMTCEVPNEFVDDGFEAGRFRPVGASDADKNLAYWRNKFREVFHVPPKRDKSIEELQFEINLAQNRGLVQQAALAAMDHVKA